jgi:hypothetical protein
LCGLVGYFYNTKARGRHETACALCIFCILTALPVPTLQR